MAKSRLPLSEKLGYGFNLIFQPDGFDTLESVTLNGEKLSGYSIQRRYLMNWLTKTSSFLGLPNRMLDLSGQSLENIGKNFIGWQEGVTSQRKRINFAKMPIVILFHLAMILPRLSRNIIRLVTELLPLYLFLVSMEAAAITTEIKVTTTDERVRALATWGYAAAMAGSYIARGLYFVGRAMTSPGYGVLLAWRDGGRIAGEAAKQFQLEPRQQKILGYAVGAALVLLSVAITMTVYTVALPYGIHAAMTLLPSAAPYLPQLIISAVSAMSKVVSPVLSAMGNSMVMPLLGKLVVSPTATGLGLLSGVWMTTVVPVLYRPLQKVKQRWHSSALENTNTDLLPEAPNMERRYVQGSTSKATALLKPDSNLAQNRLLQKRSTQAVEVEEKRGKNEEPLMHQKGDEYPISSSPTYNRCHV